ncbi:hypothetical protein M885DRAFT_463239 [Pelagophyceae sp. CCMP2097]|nr:hypothetical protein M885DRAFT_463239 [Pelagophyceae sp. CCMP2097]
MRASWLLLLAAQTAAWAPKRAVPQRRAALKASAAEAFAGMLDAPLRSILEPARRSILDVAAVTTFLKDRGAAPHHVHSLYRHLFQDGGDLTAEALHEVAGLGRNDARALDAAFGIISTVVASESSVGGRKFVVRVGSGQKIETVLIRHDTHTSGRRRATVCLSSQVGCGRKCAFCATGTMGMLQQLSSAEMLEQVWHVQKHLSLENAVQATVDASKTPFVLRNVVFMGMGEPLDNVWEVLLALDGLQDRRMFSLAAKHLTVSTVGAEASKIKLLADSQPRVRLALSLHAADQAKREAIIPAAKQTALADLGPALDYHAAASGSGAMIEYLLIAGVNDSAADADALADFTLQRLQATPSASPPFCNLIPYNPTAAGDVVGFQTPSDEAVRVFHSRLRDVHGINALIRWTSANGRDAQGACGQLALANDAETAPIPAR